MSQPFPAPPTVSASEPPSDAELLARFEPVFAQIAQESILRERERRLPFAEVELLRRSGFTAVTVPVSLGGAGASVRQLFLLLIRLGEADSNLPQLLRAHFATVHGWLLALEDPDSPRWLSKVGKGAIFGNGSHERSGATVGQLSTTLTQDAHGWVLNGTKHYCTGTIFSDWISVSAQRPDGAHVEVIADRNAPGVHVQDDWNGFGQRLTGSGTTRFDNVRVESGAMRVHDADHGPTVLPAFLELVLLATLAGVARAAVRDGAAFVRNRTRVYSQGVGPSAALDPLVQQQVGRIAADAAAAQALVLSAAEVLARASELISAGSRESGNRAQGRLAQQAIDDAELATVEAQLVVIDLVLAVTTGVFEVGGGSAISADLALDRHWRNARTLASHNPTIYQARTIGDHVINQAPLQYFWATGQSPNKS